MDDVDYLVEVNTMSDFCLSSEMDGTHGRTTFEDDPKQQLLRRVAHGRMAQWRVQAKNKMQMLGMILVAGEKLNSRECFQRLNGYRIIEETRSTRILKEQLLE